MEGRLVLFGLVLFVHQIVVFKPDVEFKVLGGELDILQVHVKVVEGQRATCSESQ